jgi:hypothetical protein
LFKNAILNLGVGFAMFIVIYTKPISNGHFSTNKQPKVSFFSNLRRPLTSNRQGYGSSTFVIQNVTAGSITRRRGGNMLPARYGSNGPARNSADTLSLKAIGDRLQRPNYLSRAYHERKIRNRRQRTDIGKYSFVNRTIQLWNLLPAVILGTLPYKPSAFRKRVRKVINVVN